MMSEFLLTVCDGPDTTLAHLTMRLAGLARARSIIRAFHEYLTQDHVLRASMIYLLPYSTDLDTIKELVATDTATEMRRVTTRGVGQKMIFFDTYDSWMASGGKLGDSPLRVVAMDLGCDQEYAGAALALNLALREAGRGGQGGNKKTCILSLSASGRSPFDPQLTGRHLPGLTPRREVVAHDPAGVEHDTASKDWRRRAAEEIQQAGAASQAPNYDGPCAIVCFMSEADFRMLSAVLRDRVRDGVRTVAVKPWVPGEPLGFLGRVPEDSKPKIRLVHVGHDANFLPQILNLKGVIVGPTVDDFVFDSVISCVVEAEAPLPGRALRLAEAVAQCAEDEDNFFIRHYAMQEPGRTPLAPSVERDLLYLVVGLVRDGPPTSPEDLPVRLPRGDVDCVSMLREATRRLRLWGLITTRAGQRQLQPTEPLGRRAAECMRHETNINAAVLLGCVEAGMPSRTAKAMIQLAMLISHGPTDIYRHGRQDARTHEAALRQAGFPRDLCGRGGLWLALGWLRALESLESPVTEGPPGTLIRANAKIVVAMSVRDRAQEWMRRLSVGGDGDDDGQLTREDVLAIDKALVRCFFFNCMSLDEAGERRQQYARDITSQVILQPRDGVTDEAIDWARTTTDAGPALFGVYTHLKRTTRPDGRYEYTPMNPTAIPFEAMSDVMAEVCPEGLDRMRPSQGIPSWYKEFRNDKDVVVPGKGEHDKGVQQATTTAAGAGAVLGVEQLTLAKNVYEVDWAWQDDTDQWRQHNKYNFTK